MAILAQNLQASSSLMPDSVFMQRLERKVRVHSVRHMRTKVAQDKWHWFKSLVSKKALMIALVVIAFVGGTGIALAATPAGHDLVQHLTGSHATASPTQKSDQHGATHGIATATANKQNPQGNTNSCAGQPKAQQLATQFSLSTESNGSAMLVICALHDGSFQGTVDGKSVTIDHALGYGEIAHLLTYAQSLAAKNGEKLTNSNVQTYVATALNTCGSTKVVPCASTPTPKAGGKPTSTPTPRVHK
jgi:hypothetical protein